MTTFYQIYNETNPDDFHNLICEGFDKNIVIREAIEWKKDVAAANDVTEWELEGVLVEWDYDTDEKLSEKNIYKCGVLN